MQSNKLLLFCSVLVLFFLPACVSREPDCRLEETFCVGLVTNLQKVTDRGFNQSTWEGLQQAKGDGVVSWIDYIETTDGRDYKKNISTFIDLGYDVIVTVGSELTKDTTSSASENPEVYFIGVDQYQYWSSDADSTNDIPNLAGLVFQEDQAGFMAGILAALVTETNKIGAVCASDDYPSIWRYGEGFRSGATYINSIVEVEVRYHNDVTIEQSFNDPEWGAFIAGEMISTGVDIIFGAGSKTGNAAILEAAGKGVFAIGTEVDQYFSEPVVAPKLLTSTIKLINPSIYALLQLARDAQEGLSAFPAGNYYGQVGLAPYHDQEDIIPLEIKVRVEEIYLIMLGGELQTGVLPSKP